MRVNALLPIFRDNSWGTSQSTRVFWNLLTHGECIFQHRKFATTQITFNFCATQTIIPSQSSCKAIPSTHSAAGGNMRFPLATPSKGDAHSWDYSRAISDVNPKLAASFNRQPSQHARLKDVTNSRKSSFVIQPWGHAAHMAGGACSGKCLTKRPTLQQTKIPWVGARHSSLN